MQNFPALFEAARLQRGLSQEDAAALIGVSRETVTKWENGTSRPFRKRRAKIRDALGVPMETEEPPLDLPSLITAMQTAAAASLAGGIIAAQGKACTPKQAVALLREVHAELFASK